MAFTIDPAAHIGTVSLTVSNLDRSVAFYENSLGFKTRQRQEGVAHLGTDKIDLIILNENPQATRPFGATGLYHFAVLVPSRLELGQVLKRIAQTQTPVQGFADHGVSEAIYLPDPDGNGIEIYRDLPRAEWPRNPDGSLAMKTDPIDLDGIVGETAGHDEAWAGLHPDTVMGHMHLKVAEVAPAEAFYRDAIGMDVIANLRGSASFMSAGGYHHHLGMNVWESRGGPPPPSDAVGLGWYEILLPTEAALSGTADSARKAGADFEETERGLLLRDPSRNGVMLAVG